MKVGKLKVIFIKILFVVKVEKVGLMNNKELVMWDVEVIFWCEV